MISISKEKLNRIYNDLINERINYKLLDNRCNPDIGWGLTPSMAKEEAIKELKKEGLIPEDFEC